MRARSDEDLWFRGALVVGTLVWIGIACGATAGILTLGPIEVFFLLAPLVILPLGIEVVRNLSPDQNLPWPAQIARYLQPFGAALTAASFLFEPGRTAALFALPWLFVCGSLALAGLMRLVGGAWRRAEDLCFAAAFLYLFVGGVWLVLSRFGATPMHFAEPIVLLTAVHFHYTGFALPIVTGATRGNWRATGNASSAIFSTVVASILAGPAILAGGFILSSPALKLIGAILLATSSVTLSGLLVILLGNFRRRLPKVLLGIAAISLALAMTLAGVYAIGEFTERYWLLIPQMARLHGTANALGFALCGLAGWALESRSHFEKLDGGK
jgi:hypothetical protein